MSAIMSPHLISVRLFSEQGSGVCGDRILDTGVTRTNQNLFDSKYGSYKSINKNNVKLNSLDISGPGR